MKTKVLLFIMMLTFSVSMFAQRGARIGYVDMEYILENVEEYREASSQLAAKVEKWKLQIEEKQAEIDKMRKALQAEKVLLTNELIAEREEEISILEKEMIQYQQDRFGPDGDLVRQRQRLVQPIQDQVFNEVQQIGADKKYDFIFDKSADVVMLYARKSYDFSDLVLKKIARTRKVSAPKKKASKNRLEDFEDEDEPITDALKARQDKAKAADATRAKTAEAKRAEQLKLREERKKAYEDRRKKLLEEREAKKKAAKNKKGEDKE